MAQKKLTYNQAMTEIEETLKKIEMEEMDVDDMSEKIKKVSLLIQICKEKLHNAEKEIEIIMNEMKNEE